MDLLNLLVFFNRSLGGAGRAENYSPCVWLWNGLSLRRTRYDETPMTRKATYTRFQPNPKKYPSLAAKQKAYRERLKRAAKKKGAK